MVIPTGVYVHIFPEWTQKKDTREIEKLVMYLVHVGIGYYLISYLYFRPRTNERKVETNLCVVPYSVTSLFKPTLGREATEVPCL